jgi:oligopeptidase A
MSQDNPLTPPTSTAWAENLPPFDRLRPAHAEPAIDAVLADGRARLASIVAAAASADMDALGERLIEPLAEIHDRFAKVWGPVSHLFGVTSTRDWRAAYNACLPKVTAFDLELSQSEPLFREYERIGASPSFAGQPPARQKVVRDALRDFKLSGVSLLPQQKARFKEIALRLSALQAKFEENLIDSMQSFEKHVKDETRLAGMTGEGKAAARAKAVAKGLEGFRLTLDFPSYDAVLRYADDRDLRRELYEAYATRASDQGPLAGLFDNGPLVEEILALRHEQAHLLGLRDYAEVSLATRMAESPDAVERFLLDLNARARPHALAELEELRAFAVSLHGVADLQVWDIAYYSEKLRARELGFSEDDLRPYFPLPQVMAGMFALVERLYAIQIERIDGVATWHPDVTTYVIRDAGGSHVGLFYLDPYAREDKRGGAWMDECLGRRRVPGGVQHPVAYLTCNFAPAVSGQPGLLTHDEVRTLFHEFGHGLHHLLTRIDEAAVSGLRGVARDAIELPSQFMENWCYESGTLRELGRHWKTREVLPDGLIDKLRASRTFEAALATVRQLEFGLLDLRLHRDYDASKGGRVLEVLARVRDEVSVLHPPPYNRMPSSFAHIFAGGYAAGYYGYKWAEVLSADAFAAFEESAFAPETGRLFRDTILGQGGAREAMDLFVEFRGRKPTIDALLRQGGLGTAEPVVSEARA